MPILCTLKLAEESADYCFTVVNFIEEIHQRPLMVLDEDTTLAHFYPPSAELFRFKMERNEFKIDNTLGKAIEQAIPIRDALNEKERLREEDKALLWAVDTLGGLDQAIKRDDEWQGQPQPMLSANEKRTSLKRMQLYATERREHSRGLMTIREWIRVAKRISEISSIRFCSSTEKSHCT